MELFLFIKMYKPLTINFLLPGSNDSNKRKVLNWSSWRFIVFLEYIWKVSLRRLQKVVSKSASGKVIQELVFWNFNEFPKVIQVRIESYLRHSYLKYVWLDLIQTAKIPLRKLHHSSTISYQIMILLIRPFFPIRFIKHIATSCQ